MVGNFEVQINPAVLDWSIERSGYDQSDLYEKIMKRSPAKYFTKEYFDDIIKGRIDPKLSDVKKIDSFLKRGVPFYFIPFIPEEDILTEFRKNNEVRFSPGAEVTLRRYHELREEIDLLLKDHSVKDSRAVDLFDQRDNPSKVAKYLRNILKYDPEEWRSKTSKEVFEYLRHGIEDSNVFIFKDNLVEGIRGCVFLGGALPSLILIKTNDDRNGEIFTLLHEFSHYLLNNEDVLFIEEKDNGIEKWCNEVTSSFLMNIEEERSEGIDPSNRKDLLKRDRIEAISKEYKLSKNAIMLKYLNREIITERIYRSFIDAYRPEKGEKKSGGGNYHHTNRDRLSRKFISLVYNSYTDGLISLHDTMEYFKIKDRSRIEQYIEVI